MVHSVLSQNRSMKLPWYPSKHTGWGFYLWFERLTRCKTSMFVLRKWCNISNPVPSPWFAWLFILNRKAFQMRFLSYETWRKTSWHVVTRHSGTKCAFTCGIAVRLWLKGTKSTVSNCFKNIPQETFSKCWERNGEMDWMEWTERLPMKCILWIMRNPSVQVCSSAKFTRVTMYVKFNIMTFKKLVSHLNSRSLNVWISRLKHCLLC